MKHISELLAPKMRELQQLERVQKARAFAAPAEKGSREWSAFNTIAEDTVNAYHVRVPKKAIVVREERHVLRIVYPPMHQFRRA